MARGGRFPLKETKLSYIALAISVGALALCGVSGMLSVFPNSSRIDQLNHQVATLTEQNAQLRALAPHVGGNRARINELDVGLTALANVLKVDSVELSKAIAAVKAAQETEAYAAKLAGRPPEGAVSSTTESPGNAPLSVSPSQTQGPDTSERQASKRPVSPRGSSPKLATDASRRSPEPVSTATPLMGADNPFSAGLDSSNAGGEVSQALAVTPAHELMSIAQVDSILGKRLSSNWYKPAGVTDELSALIQLKMSRDGKVATARIGKSSGNSAFDTSALSAVQSIGAIEEVRQLSDADFQKAYASRYIQFTPQMGK